MVERDGIAYIESTREDIAAANRVAHEVLGRRLDELPPQTRRLLELLSEWVNKRCKRDQLTRQECLFTRREVRLFSGYSNTQLKVHLDRLFDLEYILAHRGMRGSSFEYELLFDGNLDAEKPQMIGLLDPEQLIYDPKFTDRNDQLTGPKRA